MDNLNEVDMFAGAEASDTELTAAPSPPRPLKARRAERPSPAEPPPLKSTAVKPDLVATFDPASLKSSRTRADEPLAHADEPLAPAPLQAATIAKEVLGGWFKGIGEMIKGQTTAITSVATAEADGEAECDTDEERRRRRKEWRRRRREREKAAAAEAAEGTDQEVGSDGRRSRRRDVPMMDEEVMDQQEKLQQEKLEVRLSIARAPADVEGSDGEDRRSRRGARKAKSEALTDAETDAEVGTRRTTDRLPADRGTPTANEGSDQEDRRSRRRVRKPTSGAFTDVETDAEGDRRRTKDNGANPRSSRRGLEAEQDPQPAPEQEVKPPTTARPPLRERAMSLSASMDAGLRGLRETVAKAVANRIAIPSPAEPRADYGETELKMKARDGRERRSARAGRETDAEEEIRSSRRRVEGRQSAAPIETSDDRRRSRRRSSGVATDGEETDASAWSARRSRGADSAVTDGEHSDAATAARRSQRKQQTNDEETEMENIAMANADRTLRADEFDSRMLTSISRQCCDDHSSHPRRPNSYPTYTATPDLRPR